MNLPSHFTGRENECEEIIGHLTSVSTQIVSVWGSPGFGKTSTAIAVGHRLQEKDIPVYFISLRGLNSKGGLTSELLSHFRTDKSAKQGLEPEHEIGFIFERLSDLSVLILDNADDLLQCGLPGVKDKILNLLKGILNGLFEYVSTGTQAHQNPRTRQVILQCFSDKVTSKCKLF